MNADIDLGPDDREEALSRGFTQHDTLTFMGKPLRAMTAGTLDLLQKTGNRLLAGDKETPFADIAGFALLHIRHRGPHRHGVAQDEDEHRKIRAEVWKGRANWSEYVYRFLNDTPNIERELRDATDSFLQILSDYAKGITRATSNGEGKKKCGTRDGYQGSSQQWRRKRVGRLGS